MCRATARRALWLSGLALVVMLLTLGACGRHEGRPVAFVLPTAFRGPFRIEEDAAHGSDVPVQASVYRVVVSQSGRVRVKSLGPFIAWHKETASFEDGTVLPAAIDVTLRSVDDRVLLWGIGTTQDGPDVFVEWFVGTEADKKVFLHRR